MVTNLGSGTNQIMHLMEFIGADSEGRIQHVMRPQMIELDELKDHGGPSKKLWVNVASIKYIEPIDGIFTCCHVFIEGIGRIKVDNSPSYVLNGGY